MNRRFAATTFATTFIFIVTLFCSLPFQSQAGDGYELWMGYSPLANPSHSQAWKDSLGELKVYGDSDTILAAKEELIQGLSGLLETDFGKGSSPIILGSFESLPIEFQTELKQNKNLPNHPEGFLIQPIQTAENRTWVITAQNDIGVLYGVFSFLKGMQTGQILADSTTPVANQPRIQHRLLNHWDNLNRTVERVQSGQSIWEWFQLPDYVSPRYKDYARANASIGINGTVLTNVNSNALILTKPYLEKTAAIANVLRPYGIKVYLTARFSAPIEIGSLPTADPLDPVVADWWKKKVDEIYQYIPDFGGFLVKANSEGQPGPQDYNRNHADGANMLADALAPHDGIVMWRAFVYAHENKTDRHKQAYSEFVPMDGTFRKNVIIQTKNGAIDFMPREPFHPMFGAMPNTALGLELQITQEYLGGAVHLAYLAPLFEEVLDSDTYQTGEGTTVGSILQGDFSTVDHTAIAGVANIGTNRNWTGHPLLQSNWYAFGRLAWNPELSSEQIAEEWIQQTFKTTANGSVMKMLKPMLLESREAVVNYSMPLGLHHIMAVGHHYGPGPWVDKLGRADWTSVYYHQASKAGIGFDRTASGSNALEQYSPTIQEKWSNPATIPQPFLLWFHHLPWDYEMHDGSNLWQAIGNHYQQGVDSVKNWNTDWETLESSIDPQTHAHVSALLKRQKREAMEYKDACLTYFQSINNLPWPNGVEAAKRDWVYYKNNPLHHVPGDPADH